MGKKRLLIVALTAAFTSTAATASVAIYNVSGSGISGTIRLTFSPNPNTGTLGSSPNTVDPVGSYVVTGVTGTLSDANIALNNVAISMLVPRNPALPQPTNLLAPASFGFYPVTGGLPSPQGTAPGLSYDDLYYPGGSPQTASDYPFHGGVLDIYGIVFTLAGGDAVNLWSNGDMGKGVGYGIGITNGVRQDNRSGLLDRQGGLTLTAVPEPKTWAMLLIGFAAVGLAFRSKRAKVAFA